MRATVIHGPHDIRLEEVPDPTIRRPTDAIVRVVASCVCGSDLWAYRGIQKVREPHPVGHEFVGIVEETGSAVSTLTKGDFVISPFAVSDGTCANCRNGVHTSCLHGAAYGFTDEHGDPVGGGQAEYVGVPQADGTLVALPEMPSEDLIPGLLTLSDVMGTGHHAAVSARVGPGSTVVVVGDGAVGLCAVIAAKRLGAERIVAMSRHADRQALARAFGATDIVAERGEEGINAVRDMFDGIGADAVLEAVGTKASMEQSLATVRPGGFVGYVGVPSGGPELPMGQMFGGNLNVAGGVASVRAYIDELLPDVLDGTIEPGRVFDRQLPLDQVVEAYDGMDERRSIKTLLRP